MTSRSILIGVLAAILAAAGILTAQSASPLHPDFPLLDASGRNVQASGAPVSMLQTCGTCHDTDFITQHSDHSGAALASLVRLPGYPVEAPAAPADETNCFLCHMTDPDAGAYLAALAAGDTAAANEATLGELLADPETFNADGTARSEVLGIQDPSDENCAACHGTIHEDMRTPLTIEAYGWTTETTGQIFSGQRIAASGLNVSGKNTIDRSWDVHAERVVSCVDCHYATNNPVYTQTSGAARPAHLTFDPRRMDFGDYLFQPLHQLNGGAANPMACTDCHEALPTHQWLPYAQQHMDQLACETCHIPTMPAPARASTDWTVVRADGGPVETWRGIDGDPQALTTSLIMGSEPVLLPVTDASGETVLAPHNVITTWYWADGDGSPVPPDVLRAAYLTAEGTYHPDVLAAFDADGSGTLGDAELLISTDAQEALIAERLGVPGAHIASEVLTYPIHHGVVQGDWATASCETCHTAESRLVAPITLANRTPGGVVPAFEPGGMLVEADGTLIYQPETQPASGSVQLYVLGHDAARWADLLGIATLLGTIGGVTIHGGLRVLAARRRPDHHGAQVEEVYMYAAYERLWHWLQTLTIFLLIATGLVIHKPDLFGMFGFAWMVRIHNVLAALLLANAALAAFYHLASGEIKQFLPQPRGFFDRMIRQTLYYVRGIFRDEPHPFEKTPERKMNPIQQVTYFGLLNVLLPLQVITGILMWGIQRWPQIGARIGGLTFIAPLHTLGMWLFATFIIVHVYMTTTGHTPLANIKAMLVGWDEVEVHHAPGD
ncbi:MAG: cytochrome b/b6 domain-containing protein [Anaerolineae bacterium]